MRFDNAKKTLSLFALVVAVIIAGVIPARADFNSSAAFVEQCPTCALNAGGTAVDMMKVFIEPVAGVTFATPGLTVLDASWVPAVGWAETDVIPTYSTASGPAMSDFVYILNFNINSALYPSTVAFGVDVYYFQNLGGTETLIDDAGLTYNGPSSFDTTVNYFGITAPLNPGGLDGETVPEPTSILLLGSVIVGLAFGYRKRLA